jgi:NAD(P)-dependent dehydrogenase (short-subunit alcohol dehydrogenase family)
MTEADPRPGVHLILGASGGIGSALARRLAARGARLVLAARRAEPLEALAGELGADAVALDATSFEEVEQALAGAVERHGRVDGLACCVGSIVLKPAHRTSVAELEEVLRLNLFSAFAAVRAAAQPMARSGGGSIALLASAAARRGLPNHEAIAAAKAGVIGLTLSAAATYAPRGVRVNAVAPGLVDTPMAAAITGNELARKASEKMHPLGRIGSSEDVARALEWLLDPAASWVTGQVIGVDGGLSTVAAKG